MTESLCKGDAVMTPYGRAVVHAIASKGLVEVKIGHTVYSVPRSMVRKIQT